MNYSYTCRYCNCDLNPGTKIVMVATTAKQRGLILLSPKPGNYQIIMSKDLDIQEGDLLELYCPICGASFTSPLNPNLAEIRYNRDDEEGKVEFSRRLGEHATYFVGDGSIHFYGENAGTYGATNFFGVSINKED